MRVVGGVKAHAPDDPLDVWRGDLQPGEPHDVPAVEERCQIFLGIGYEPGGAIVPAATFDENAALDLEDRPAFDVGKIRTPFSFCMEHEFTFQLRATEADATVRTFALAAGAMDEADYSVWLKANSTLTPRGH